ncbi:hypothetical protein DT351_11025 (plasmid) [Latilactobacillus curvatus]|uniref:Helix-turn-helix domain-containing protein n=1 Tax=Latilactobacillus curvatus TaxID=28038 RepID=A0A385AGZ6_LATCU|nr:hypothetical protein [Latilactobacillus curvatus]AXN36873.1 hypothetical protein DT351_11025 [Latilactobacillus curvatus]
MLVSEAFELLNSMGITTNIESVRRWIRQGAIKARPLDGSHSYWIERDDLNDFIESKLKAKNKRQVVYRQGYVDGFNAAKKLFNKGE